jgi:hypothetical protein
VRLGPGAEQLLLLLGDRVRGSLPQLARDVGTLVALERVGLVEVLKAAWTEILPRVPAVDVLPASGQPLRPPKNSPDTQTTKQK